MTNTGFSGRLLHWPLIGVVLLILACVLQLAFRRGSIKSPMPLYTSLLIMIGAVLAVGLLFVDYRLTETLAYMVYSIVCLLLLAVLLQGRSAGGAQRWLVIGSMNLQPSELAKLSTVLCLALFCASYRRGRLFDS
ncbi:MAG: FtsW/RodA/SpoVE family cell cycle protein [Myxococcota bacterium]